MNNHIIELILSFTTSGKDYKNFVLVCKDWYKTLNKLFPKGSIFTNHLTTLLKLFPNEKWNYDYLSKNPNIDIDYVKNNDDKPWNYENFSENPSVTWEIFKNNRGFPWYRDNFVKNPSITIDMLSRYILCPVYELSKNPNLTWGNILANPDSSWDYKSLSYNPNICNTENWQRILDNADKDWDYFAMAAYGNLTFKIISENLDKFRHYGLWVANKNFDYEDFKKLELKKGHDVLDHLDYQTLSGNPRITLDIVKNNSNKPWKYQYLVQNPNVTWNDIVENKKLYKHASNFSSNPNLTWDIVVNNPDIKWNFDSISCNHFGKRY